MAHVTRSPRARRSRSTAASTAAAGQGSNARRVYRQNAHAPPSRGAAARAPAGAHRLHSRAAERTTSSALREPHFVAPGPGVAAKETVESGAISQSRRVSSASLGRVMNAIARLVTGGTERCRTRALRLAHAGRCSTARQYLRTVAALLVLGDRALRVHRGRRSVSAVHANCSIVGGHYAGEAGWPT